MCLCNHLGIRCHQLQGALDGKVVRYHGTVFQTVCALNTFEKCAECETRTSRAGGSNDRSNRLRIIRSKEFRADRAWGALEIAAMGGITTRLHWTDKPYVWHVNDGQEVFVVLDGVVDMHYRENGLEMVEALHAGDIFFADIGCEHVAHPQGEARILVIENEGSV